MFWSWSSLSSGPPSRPKAAGGSPVSGDPLTSTCVSAIGNGCLGSAVAAEAGPATTIPAIEPSITLPSARLAAQSSLNVLSRWSVPKCMLSMVPSGLITEHPSMVAAQMLPAASAVMALTTSLASPSATVMRSATRPRLSL